MANTSKFRALPYLMWIIASTFFCYQFVLRLWPSLLMQDIMKQFSINATSFGLLSSMYYYGYAGMQIPLALMLDRFSAKKVICACAFLCGAAALLFTYTNNFYLALLGRFLIGAGSAVGFLGASKVISEWFPADKYARMVGFTFTFGLLGAIYGGKPLSLLIEKSGSHPVSVIVSCASLAIALGVLLLLKSPKTLQQTAKEPLSWQDFKQVLSSKAMWLLAIANLLMVGSLEGFADVWGVNYLVNGYGFSKAEAAKATSAIFIGMLFGGPFLAYFSEKIGHYSTIIICGISMALILLLLIYTPSAQSYLSICLALFTLGIMCCYQVIMFAAGAELVKPHLLSVSVAMLNCINMLGGSFFHVAIGKTMDIFWTGAMNAGMKIYTTASYEKALLIIPVCSLIGSLVVFLVGRTSRASVAENMVQEA
jgi:predicted MFS family arabinose efflux permease